MLLITGTQRCGTSLVAKFCQKLGFNLGSNLWHDDINGGLESHDICRWYSDELKDISFPFSDFPNFDKPYIRPRDLVGPGTEVRKFSYMMMDPIFVDMWMGEVGNETPFLILTRDMAEVYHSKQVTKERIERFSKDADILKQPPDQLALNWHLSYLQILEYEIPHVVLRFPHFLRMDSKSFVEILLEGGLPLNVGEADGAGKTWSEMIDWNKVTVSPK